MSKRPSISQALRARDAFLEQYKPDIEAFGMHLAVGLTKVAGAPGFAIHCQSLGKHRASNSVRASVHKVLGTNFRHGGVTYLLNIKFMGPAMAQ